MTKIPKGEGWRALLGQNTLYTFWELEHWNFDIVSYFEFRVSNFRFSRSGAVKFKFAFAQYIVQM